MATGVTKREQLSDDALTAELPHRDPHPLPSGNVLPTLSYDNRLSEAAVLEPLAARFRTVGRGGALVDCSGIRPSTLMLTDNLFGLHALRASGAKVTLFYLDPPYNTGMGFQSRQLEHAYKDDWSTAAYVEYMRRRFILMRELLTDDGSLYVHIDHRMLAHLKIVLDDVFGPDNFRNIITRRKCSSKNFTKHQYSNIHDYILFYTKTSEYKWNQPGDKPDDDWIDKEYDKVDERGRYKLVPVHAPGTRNGETGRPWRGMMPPPGKHWQYVPAKLDALDTAGEMHWSRNGNPRRKVYLTDDKTVPLTDYWAKYRDAHHQSIAITGYPTEKNVNMLRMIVGASSAPGDLVVDPFCGSGTTLHAAADLGRKWIGMDQSFIALKAATKRFRYGAERMGDFVNRQDRVKDGVGPLDLFPGADVSEGTPAAPAAPAASQGDRTIDFDLLVDEELFDQLPREIAELASL